MLLSDEHFSVDGTPLEAWVSTKSFRPKDGSGPPPDPGATASRETYAFTTDPDAQLYRMGPGTEATQCFIEHALMDNCNGMIVGATTTTRASWHAKRLAALPLITPHADRPQRITVGSGRWQGLRHAGLRRRDAGDQRRPARGAERQWPTFGHRRSHHAPPGYAVSLHIRERIEDEARLWAKLA